MTTRDVVFTVAPEHEDRAAEFCRQHRHFTTTEAMDDLATEFEKVARNTRAEMLLWLRETCGLVIHPAVPVDVRTKLVKKLRQRRSKDRS